MSDPYNTDVPIHNPEGRFHIWHYQEIYRGPNTGRYVPNIDDGVWDWDTGLWRVVDVDTSTGLSELIPYEPPKENGVSNENILLGVNYTCQQESYRAYINTDVIPHTLALDSRLHIYGTTASYVKVFMGTDISDNGQVISAMYDQGGTFLGENIPLELVLMPDQHNLAVKTPMVGYTLRQPQDGDVLTVVAYDDVGRALSLTKVLAMNTDFIRTTDASRRFVTSIHLESPFVMENDERMLQIPINMPVDNTPITGVVTYSDGSETRLPANGGKFKLHGLTNFVATIVGQRIPLVLSYQLSENEICYGASAGDNKHVSEKYWVTTVEFEEAFNVKLFAFPNWVDDIEGYKLDYYLYTLKRSDVYKVNHLIEIDGNSEEFNPMLWGHRQRLTVSLEMNRVDTCFKRYRHVQTLEVVLRQPGEYSGTPWLIGFRPNQVPMYGEGIRANVKFVNTNLWKLDISNDLGSVEYWLEKVFYNTFPLYHPDIETRAIAPNMFILHYGDVRREFYIDQWDEELQLEETPFEGRNIYIEFIYRTVDNDLQLGIGAMAVKRI